MRTGIMVAAILLCLAGCSPATITEAEARSKYDEIERGAKDNYEREDRR